MGKVGGNIIIMLYLGAKVFLNSKSPIYAYFKELGAFIYTTEEFETNNNLSDEEIETNQSILSKSLTNDLLDNRTRSMVEALINDG